MKSPENSGPVNQQLERRQFIGYALAAGITIAIRPMCVQALAIDTGNNAAEAESSSKDSEQHTGRRHLQSLHPITLFLCGDVMTGRGIDQVLPHPGNPILFEGYMKSARGYVELAEETNGPIPKPVDFPYIWGDALAELDRRKPDLRIINLETAITRSDDVEHKAVNYRMSPHNIPCITAANIDCCALANNHVLDWGYSGLAETLKTLKDAHIKIAGAGRDIREAQGPAVMTIPEKGRVLVFSFGSETSGIPWSWAAAPDKPGVNLLPDFSAATVRGIRDSIGKVRLTRDIVIASIHWGSNWGYQLPPGQQEFAHQLIDEADVDIVHGHSSHHVKGIEVYKGKLILYGCGDFVNDYEGISGHEIYRGDLTLMYFVCTNPSTGKLISLSMTPMQVKRFRLNHAAEKDVLWLRDVLNREGKKFGTSVDLQAGNTLALGWASAP
ncbi:poly-gamma-glutamate synthesis protein (capsule biosynthesis protein) [Nitrosospira sp. Nsp18]|uniref:CapA family protein n=1 Tax=Nitrosospira sp. Nsp18 TaxID=1855334 RepID=UPI000882A6F9|nr:CapA family protein [Nitrosospira sp. Nsp18]SDA21554.1 poly-gamma-glutamate synthesis protein (capsule biosynthesis protein) [Nitrosospira sp. Nsp18]